MVVGPHDIPHPVCVMDRTTYHILYASWSARHTTSCMRHKKQESRTKLGTNLRPESNSNPHCGLKKETT